jgi:hypothetical protein
MKKALIALLLVIGIASCNKVQEVEDISSSKHEYVDGESDITAYDAVDIDETQEGEVSNGPTEWIWDGSQYDTLYIGATLRISNIDGDKVYLVMSK